MLRKSENWCCTEKVHFVLYWSGLRTASFNSQTAIKSVVSHYSTSVDNIPYFFAVRVIISQQTRCAFFKCARKSLPACNNKFIYQETRRCHQARIKTTFFKIQIYDSAKNTRLYRVCLTMIWKNGRKAISDRDNVSVGRIRVLMNCWMSDQRSSPTRQCKRTVHTSAGVCCRETRCTTSRRSPSTADDTSTSSCRPLRFSWSLPESFQCFRTARTRRKCLP